ncbi:hypothetical protein SPONN_2828 [uncultured Candidatus Thioglobus sp.]|nr:hypothetical protein SPONN_2828 [uncultured Candidatus Thioglobus sp.]
MSEESKIKEEIGWYKVIFAILVATVISLLSWFAQNYELAKPSLLIFCLITITIVVVVIVMINRRVFKKLDRLGEL